MKPRTLILLVGAALLVLVAWSAKRQTSNSGPAAQGRGACCPLLAVLDARTVAAPASQDTTNAAVQHVIAYYFHGTVRCETCLLIENLAKTAIEQQFPAELAAQRLVFLPVNYEQPENAHFVIDYQLPCPSLVLVRQRDGKDEQWKLLGDTWNLVHDPPEFNKYVADEVRGYLGGSIQPEPSDPTQPPPPTDRP